VLGVFRGQILSSVIPALPEKIRKDLSKKSLDSLLRFQLNKQCSTLRTAREKAAPRFAVEALPAIQRFNLA
jgi:hypothetical protein